MKKKFRNINVNGKAYTYTIFHFVEDVHAYRVTIYHERKQIFMETIKGERSITPAFIEEKILSIK
jgi:hypothetical protein